MKFSHALLAGALCAAQPVLAVYAPVPEQEQGKNLTVSLRAGYQYDSNIFGAATGEISSNVWHIAPRLSYNASVTDQTFVSAQYGLSLDHIDDRPGDKLLDSHDVMLRLAHAFTRSTSIDIYDSLIVSRNPESLLNGVPQNTDQSFTRNQLDGRVVTAASPKIGVTAKVRSALTRYRNATLGRSLDRIENLYGFAGDYAILPELKGIAEYRHQDVFYRKQGELKNKRSDYLMAGVDYDAARKLTLTSRFGAEWRRRALGEDTTAPFVELSGRYAYAERSFVTGGYAYTIDETSDPGRFTDQKVNRAFVNIQHAVSALIVASLSAGYEPAELQGRSDVLVTQADLDERTARLGAALSYLPTKNWIVTATIDFDCVRSDDPSRSVERHRTGVSATYTF